MVALSMLDSVTEKELDSLRVSAPWNPTVEKVLGAHFLDMIGHLSHHKTQLFLYLKLQGKPVNTGHLYGL